MRFLAFLLLLTVPVWSGADVYKWTDESGRTHYSDRPIAGAEQVPVERASPAQTQTAAGQDGPEAPAAGPYKSFEIVSPKPNETFRSSKGEVPVSLLVEPALDANHHLRFLLDGQPVPGDVQGTQILLKGLPLGSHRIQAEILDAQGKSVALSSATDFHLRNPLPESLPK